MNDRSIFPIVELGDLGRAVGRCELCERELVRRPLAFAACDAHPEANIVVEAPNSSITSGLVNCTLHPLKFSEGEQDHVEHNGNPSAETILKFCCGTTHSSRPEKIVARYQQLHQGIRIQVVPAIDYIDKKIIVPLLQAQSAYMTANFIATIALCGIVGEMVANLAWEINEPYIQINRKALTVEMQKAIFGEPVENMTQEVRIKIMMNLDVITPETWEKFKRVKDVRNEYVHFHRSSATEQTQKQQAAELFNLAQDLVCAVIGQDVSNGRFNLNQNTFMYLQARGLVQPFPSEHAAASVSQPLAEHSEGAQPGQPSAPIE